MRCWWVCIIQTLMVELYIIQVLLVSNRHKLDNNVIRHLHTSMPRSSAKACPRCLRAKCDCKKDNRPTFHQRGYTWAWRKYRLQFLQDHPLCEHCLELGVTTEATDVDHIIDHKGEAKLFWLPENHQALCHSCHSKKTAATHKPIPMKGHNEQDNRSNTRISDRVHGGSA